MPDLELTKHVPTAVGLHEIIAARWSPRAFSDKKVSSEDLTKIFTAAAWAASSSNEQPWRFLIGHKGDDTYAKILAALVPFNQDWAKSAPILIATVAKKTFTKNNEPNGWALHDVGAASAQMCLQAIALGIHTHGMAGFDKEKIHAHLGLPAGYEAAAVWALGYLGDPESLPEHLKKMELAPRERKPLDQVVYKTWETPAGL